MSYYTHCRHTDAGEDVHLDVSLRHTGDLHPYYTQHKHMDGPLHICVDVHSEVSVRKNIYIIFVTITNTKFHENLSLGNLVTPH